MKGSARRTGLLSAHLGFLGAASVIGAIAWALYVAVVEFGDASRWVNQTQDVLQGVSEVEASMARAESAQRAYLLTAERSMTVERDRQLSRLDGAVAQVARLTADNPVQQARTRQLAELIAERTRIMLTNARLWEQGPLVREQAPLVREQGPLAWEQGSLVSGRAHEMVLQGQRAYAQVNAVTDEIRQEEMRLLAARRADEQHRLDRSLFVLGAALLVSLAVLLPVYIAFVRQSRRRYRAEMQLRDLAESLPVTVYQFRTRTRTRSRGAPRFEFVASSVESLHGVSLKAALNDREVIWNSVVEADRPGLSQALHRAARDLSPFECEYRVGTDDGQVRWIRTSASLRKESDGSVLWNGYWADITESKRLGMAVQQAKEDADAANRAKSTFLATMSHEIRTPMNGVLGMLELLALSRLDAEQRATLGVVRESGRSLLRIIDDILDFSRIEAGRLDLKPEPASLADVVERTRQLFTGMASSKGLLLKHSVDARISTALLFDPLRVGQILNNFVSNALKFTVHGSVEIAAVLLARVGDEERVRLTVTDTGIGVTEQDQQQLFQPFAQAQDHATRRGGSGLGLVICRRLADMMHGTAEMESEPGRGTTMSLTLSLPIANADQLATTRAEHKNEELGASLALRRAAPTVEQAEAEGTLVLVVDDHPTNRLVLLHQVVALGYAAESAEDGLEALDLWESGRFGLVITDCNMPRMNGYELVRTIRSRELARNGARVPIVACTANALGGEAEACFAAGMNDYLVKPVQLSELMTRLDQWLPVPRIVPGERDAAVAPAHAAAACAPLDHSMLVGISNGDTAVEREILFDFRGVNDDDWLMLRRAVDNDDISLVTQVAHRIKGASKMVGAWALASVCERIERAGRSGDWRAVKNEMEAFKFEVQRLNAYVATL